MFFGTGVAMALANKFAMAYASFLLFGFCGLGYWLTSPWLEGKRKLLFGRKVSRNAERYAIETRKYYAWEWGVSFGIIVIASGFMSWTQQLHAQQVQDEAFAGLMLTVNGNNPLKSSFTITNASAHDLGTHSMVATPNMLVGNRGTAATAAQNAGDRLGLHFDCGGFRESLSGGGNAQTYDCLHNIIMDLGIDCVDVTLNFTYRLKEQRDIERRKDFRLVSGSKDNFLWHLQPVENPENYCSLYLTPEALEQMKHGNVVNQPW